MIAGNNLREVSITTKACIMKKILFVCDANNFPEGAFRFVQVLQAYEPVLLAGAFFHSVNYDMFIPSDFVFNTEPVAAFTDTDVEAVKTSISRFKAACQHAGIEYRVHEESDVFSIRDLERESRFADLLVMSESLFFSHIEKEQPNKYMRQVFHNAECPIIVVPEKFSIVRRLAIAYDGKSSSMFALKQFCQLLPQLTSMPTEVCYWVEKTDEDIPELSYIEEYIGRHFTDANFRELYFDAGKYLAQWAQDKADTFFVTGSYSRSGIASLFHKSFVDAMVKDSSALIFIAHNS